MYIGNVLNLPFQVPEVAERYELTSTAAITNLRPHAISPYGNYIAGTTLVTSMNGSRGFSLSSVSDIYHYHPFHPTGFWVEDQELLASTWDGVSVRGVNDNGDVVGFLLRSTEPPSKPRPMVRLKGKSAVELDIPGSNGLGVIFGITNARYVSGWHGFSSITEVSPKKGFVAQLDDDGKIISGSYQPFEGQLHGTNEGFDQIYVKGRDNDLRSFARLAPWIPGPEVDFNQNPLLAGKSTNVLGINDDRFVVGSVTTSGNTMEGFVGKITETGYLTNVLTWKHPAAVKSTQFFGIDNFRRITGAVDSRIPILLYLEWDQRPSLRFNPLTDYVVKGVSSSVAAGAGGWVWPHGGVPEPEPPPMPFILDSRHRALAQAIGIRSQLSGIRSEKARLEMTSIIDKYLEKELRELREEPNRFTD